METVSAHLSKELRSQYKRRALSLRKGDEVKIIRGENAGKTGTVENVDTKNMAVAISGIKVKRTIGTEKALYIEPTNIVITNLNLSDKMRQKILLRKVKEVKVPQAPEPKKEIVEEVKEKKVEAK